MGQWYRDFSQTTDDEVIALLSAVSATPHQQSRRRKTREADGKRIAFLLEGVALVRSSAAAEARPCRRKAHVSIDPGFGAGRAVGAAGCGATQRIRSPRPDPSDVTQRARRTDGSQRKPARR